MNLEEYPIGIREPEQEGGLAAALTRPAADQALRPPGDDEALGCPAAARPRQDALYAQFEAACQEILAEPAFPDLLAAHGQDYRGLAEDPAYEEPVMHPHAPKVWLQVQAARHAFGELEFGSGPEAERDRAAVARKAAAGLLQEHGQRRHPEDFPPRIKTEAEDLYYCHWQQAEELLAERFAALRPFALAEDRPDNTAEILVALSTHNEENSRRYLGVLFYLEDWERRDRERDAALAAAAAAAVVNPGP